MQSQTRNVGKHNRPRFRGIITPMITPLSDPSTLDTAGLERLIDHLVTGGVDGIFVLGTTGEGPSHSYALRHELVERTVDQVAGAVPVLVGVTDTAADEAVNMAVFSKKAGADAVVLAPPCYFKPDQRGLLNYLRTMARRFPLPVFLYNMPSTTGVMIDPLTVAGAVEERNIIGFKDSSGDMTYFFRIQSVFANRPDLTLLIGPEELLTSALMAGAHGGVAGGSNLEPRLFAEMMDASDRKDTARMMQLHERVMDISNRLYGLGTYSSAFLASIKTSLKLRGICEDAFALPFQPMAEQDRQTVRRHLDSLGLLPDKGRRNVVAS